jgi:hypothetical protein
VNIAAISAATPISHHRGLSVMQKIIAWQVQDWPFRDAVLQWRRNMKLTSMLAALAGFVILTGCESVAPTLLSVEPVATAKDSAIDPALLGTWEELGVQDMLCIVRQGEQGGYQIAVVSGTSVMSFQAQLLTVGDAEFLDLAPAEENEFRIPGHAVLRLWINAGSLRWAFLDSDWLKQQAAALATHSGDSKMQLFAPTAAVRAFITANGANDKAYGKVVTWQRVQ